MNNLAPYLKAFVGALIAGLASLQQALDGDNSVTAQEWTGVVIALLSGLALVWVIPNKDPLAKHQDESVQPTTLGTRPITGGHSRNDLGESALTIVLVVLAVVVLVVLLLRLL